MGGLGAPELIIILVIILVLFGAKKLPEVAGSLGKSIKEFRKSAEQADGESDDAEAAASTADDES